ncbi:MAG: tetratricopeptide repeat protein [Pseudomonadota bacterium]
MKAHSLALITGWGLSLAATALADTPGDDARLVFTKVSPSVVTVRIVDDQGVKQGLGSGVVIGSELVATNCHVVQEAVHLQVASEAGEFAGQWVRQDPQRDICILAVKGLTAPAASLRRSDTLVIGEPVFAVGNPLGFGLAVSAGLVTAIDGKDQPPVVIASTALSPGSSGGGMFDREGRLVGLTTAVLGTGQNLNLVLSSDGLEQLAVAGPPPRAPETPPAPERRWRDEALALQHGNEWQKLEQLANDWHAAQPLAAPALTFMGVAQQALTRNREAAATLRRALDLDDHDAFTWLIYGTALKEDGHPIEAAQALDRAEALLPIFAQPHAVRSVWALQEGKLDEARQHARESLRLAPGNSAAWRNLGQVEDAGGNKAAALHAYQTAVQLGDSNAQTLIAIGLAEMQRNRLAAAEEALRKATTLAPELADGWNGLGSVLFRSNRLDEAQQAYDQALTLAPGRPEILTNRAIVRRALKQPDAALEDLGHAIATDPAYLPAWRLFGVLQMEAKNYSEAVLAFSTIDAQHRATADDLVSLGESQAENGDVPAGLATLARAESLDPQLARMCLSTAKVLGRQGENEKALVYLERALQIEPTNHAAWSSKGYGLMKLGRLTEAEQALETAVTLAPDYPNGWINLGETQLQSRNLGRAIQTLEKATLLAPQAMDARFFLAQAYLGTHQLAKSREQAERLLDQQPGYSPALALLALSFLMEDNIEAAQVPYSQLKEKSPDLARTFRAQAIAKGLVSAAQLTE